LTVGCEVGHKHHKNLIIMIIINVIITSIIINIITIIYEIFLRHLGSRLKTALGTEL
jgi:hypothetical protein